MLEQIRTVKIEDELKNSYIDYAMSVIVGRALPDVRDGLKPVQRRVLYAMYELNNEWNKPYKKSARVVGDVIGKYHPHGETAVYDAVVRMAQDFSLRYVLIDGQGNFGSVDGDSAAAMRYTEIRMAKITHKILVDLDKDTVDFVPNYDNTEFAPSIMPTRIPNLLVNGTTGIAVGMATNIPPHHLGSIMQACISLVENPETSDEDLIAIVKGPDFPTGGTICGRRGIIDAYKTGRGKIYLRAKAHIEDNSGRSVIVVTELPYVVNKARLLEKIAFLVREKKLTGISTIRDESDRDGMRVVIECHRNENADVLLNKLYVSTQMQTVFGINMVALDANQPKCMTLAQILKLFITHRQDVVRRRTRYELQKAREKGHVLEGLSVALANLDEIIALIKGAATPSQAKGKLLAKKWSVQTFKLPIKDVSLCQLPDATNTGLLDGHFYQLSDRQAQSILDLRLQKLTGMERDKILHDYQIVIDLIKKLINILTDYSELMSIVKREFLEVIEEHQDERKTQISDVPIDVDELDLIPEESLMVTISNLGYTKAQGLSEYQAQHRGGKGKLSTTTRDNDYMKYMTLASSHEVLLCFTTLGRVYWLNVCHIPRSSSRTAKGKPINNLIGLQENESISAVLPISREKNQDDYFLMATKNGVIKKISQMSFSRPRTAGIIALSIDESDSLISVSPVVDGQDIFLFSNSGKAIRFPSESVRAVGRTARGVRGIKLKKDQKVISMIVSSDKGSVLTISENGFGKQTDLAHFRRTSRGGQGVIAMQDSSRNGVMKGALLVKADDEFMVLTDGGSLVRIRVNEISQVGRNTQGVRIIDLGKHQKVANIQLISDCLISLEDPISTDTADDTD